MYRNENKEQSWIDEAANVFASIGSGKDMRKFFDEIFTPAERRDIALRWQLMKRLKDGAAQRKIAEEIGVSLCKITRGAGILKDPGSVSNRLLESK